MPAGLPPAAWVLLGSSIGLGVGLVLAYWSVQRGSADKR